VKDMPTQRENVATILVVDDTPENIDVLKGLLQDDYRVKVALNGAKALKIAQSDSPPDLILLDVMMPEMDGFEVCERLKADEKTKDIPVIFITAKHEIEDEVRGLSTGAVDFIPKPISPPIVEARVKTHLQLIQTRKTLEEMPKKLSRYLSPQVVQSIFEGKKEATIGTSRKKLTIFFSDIVGFTAKSEDLEPEDLSFAINLYLDRMANIALEHGGTLDKFIGDAVMVFFGDPESDGVKVDAKKCVNMAKAMHEAIPGLIEEFNDQGIDMDLKIRVGVASGYCTVGNFGSEVRMDYTLLGRVVNLASRLEGQAEPGGILVSNDTWILIKDQFEGEAQEPIQVKGFDKPVQPWKILF
jgi:class 3 adenylate cyclase